MSDGEGSPRFRPRWYEEVGSTNDIARAAAEAGEPEGLWVLARRQTAGRGRQGRTWLSPEGNFHSSLLLRPGTSLAAAASLSLVTGLAVAEAIHAVTDGLVAPRLKWPNDVLVGPAKLAGILLEGGAAAMGCWVVVGIGVNLAHKPEVAHYPTVALADLGAGRITPERFQAALAGPLAVRLAAWRQAGFGGLRSAWLAAATGLGAEVRLRLGTGVHRGRLADLAADGSILLETAAGRLERHHAGELFFDRVEDGLSGPARED